MRILTKEQHARLPKLQVEDCVLGTVYSAEAGYSGDLRLTFTIGEVPNDEGVRGNVVSPDFAVQLVEASKDNWDRRVVSRGGSNSVQTPKVRRTRIRKHIKGLVKSLADTALGLQQSEIEARADAAEDTCIENAVCLLMEADRYAARRDAFETVLLDLQKILDLKD